MSRRFSFSTVTLYKEHTLGRGSYGSVCKAKCDTLTCAAKIIHSVFFDFADPGRRTVMERFEQECQLLSAIKHPNIVQYLDIHIDEDTKTPVLLMELMDQNLTHYLEAAEEPPPFHLQVNFSLDIATALAYLHSNDILHRDLSSNNILLLGERRAKVTDFGMSQLERVNSRMTPATQCPGTLVYMPPEALKERPHHTDKVDVFSLGVLLLQMLTQKFPEPTDRFVSLLVPDPRKKKKMIEVQAPVKETDRRQNHINLVTDNPLLTTSLRCLKDNHEDRPPASQLCVKLEEMQSSDAYKDSAAITYKSKYDVLKKDYDQLENTLIKKLEETFQHLLEDKDLVIQEKDYIIRAMSNNLRLCWRKSKNAPVKFKKRGHTAVVGDVVYFCEVSTTYPKMYKFDVKEETWKDIPIPPSKHFFTIVTINDSLTAIGGSLHNGEVYTYNKNEKWVQKFPPMGIMLLEPFAASTRDFVVVIGKDIQCSPQINGSVLNLQTLQWTAFQPYAFSPTQYTSAFAFVKDNTLYHAGGIDFSGPGSYFFSCPLNEIRTGCIWKKICAPPYTGQTVAHYKEHILGIGGGVDSIRPARKRDIHRYDVNTDTWVKLGEMEVACAHCMVAVVGDKMIVVGDDDSGEDTSITHIATVYSR